MTTEKDNAKEITRQEIETEKRELEDKIASLYQEIIQNNANKDQIMAQLHSRLKFNLKKFNLLSSSKIIKKIKHDRISV